MPNSVGRRVVLGFALLIALTRVFAAEVARADISISVAPSLVELQATPGGTGELELTVSNDGSDDFDVHAAIETYKDGTGDRSAVEWVTAEPATFSLAARSQQTVHLVINVPAGNSSGGRYAVAAFRTSAPSTSGSQVGVSGQLGVPLLIGVQAAQPLDRSASVAQFSPVLQPDGGLGFWTGLRNTGSTHITSRGGAVDLMGADGQSVGHVTVPESTAILPSSEESLMTDESLPFQSGAVYRARTSVDFGGAAPASAEVSFTGQARLIFTELAGAGSSDRGLSLAVGLQNQGDLGLLPGLQLAIIDSTGQRLQTVSPPRPPLLLPGQTARIETQLPRRLPSGDYVLSAHAQYGTDSVDRETQFHVGALSAETPPAVTQQERQQEPAATAAESTTDRTDVTGTLPRGTLTLTILIACLSVLLWLPALAPFRRRVRRAARSFAETEDD